MTYSLEELNRESAVGNAGKEANDREIRVIDLSNFEQRRSEITEQLWSAATEIGFFQLSHHGISKSEIDAAFFESNRFFNLKKKVKERYLRPKGINAGWESRSQIRPSTGTADQKESYQITQFHMQDLWPTEEELPAFQHNMMTFENKCWSLGMKVLSCFADKLGFEHDFFSDAHDPNKPDYQSTLRLLHYFPTEGVDQQENIWRAGAHTDFDCLTLLFQHEGHGGLQVCPGKEIDSQSWTSIPPRSNVVTCNIGDMLMRWSDDRLKSNFHRVRMPLKDEYCGSRHSIAFFCQANKEQTIQGPDKRYPPITAKDFLNMRIQANFTKADY
ncbi:isopenicillin N synthase family dioxygenase [Marinomonas mediterranea]|uniref:2OG-Fe(II) oxygenase n=1 Tax=Marinomonas mediterranea (strain ATCC 700492 / JCM 21426 / NBRC 103028 / MMB-1) TaxID=717774 RepID=F2JXZ8_MARM1|nr:2OG-Fe(II) oxygenase family protein [Marinomonas mediterranea]ADZ89647.1 2OG-Fe(II) oxygenase [Marinomonas mediterranea MMB-1]WCN15885.1 isopenicillin N synthase family oxygenase [Marinomonas mediterranea MMB-1]